LMEERAGLLVARGLDLFGFLHLTFEEYLAARYLVEWLDYEEEVAQRAADPRWDEVIRLGAACLRGRYVARLVEAVLKAGLKGEAVGRDVVLAGQCVVDVGPRVVGGQVLEALTPRLVETMQGLDVPIRTRADAGEVLDELGWLPDDLDAWVHVPGGTVYLHHSQRTETVPELWMARYPVTNAQYERFIEAGGYDNPAYWSEETGARRWWEKEGHRQGQPYYWDNPRFGCSRRCYPVVGVTWYEALAYCTWLNELLERTRAGEDVPEAELVADLVDTPMQEITLPSEAEWVRAAGGEGNDDRYPWHPPAYMPSPPTPSPKIGRGGKRERPELALSEVERVLARANVEENGLGHTTPVAMYPAVAFFPSDAEGGIMDLAGNVWEWTRDPWEKESPYKAVRGGSWWSSVRGARVGSRLRRPPEFLVYLYGGFRVCARWLSSDS
ncbi:MAG: formylglycine-generating enzyme family protein, partial [Anaerolineae bacterium]